MRYSNGAIVKTALLLSKKVRFIFIWVEQVVSFDGKQHNRGQEGAGLACVKLHARPAEEFIYRERAIGTSAIQEIFANIKDQIKNTPHDTADADWAALHLPFAGEVYMGHLRYSTTGRSGLSYVHPF